MDLAAGVQVCIFIFLSTLGHVGRNGFRFPAQTIFPLSHLPSILSCSLYLIPTTFSTHPIPQTNFRTIPSHHPAALLHSHRSTSFSRPTLAQPYSPEDPKGRPGRRMIPGKSAIRLPVLSDWSTHWLNGALMLGRWTPVHFVSIGLRFSTATGCTSVVFVISL